jgi:hypothetical protein
LHHPDVTEVAAGGKARLFRALAVLLGIAGRHGEVAADLVIKLAVTAAAVKKVHRLASRAVDILLE